MATHKINIEQMKFVPDSVTIAKGDTVEWDNKMTFAHTATSDTKGQFDSGHINGGKSWSHTFQASGTFPYHCEIHKQMKGTVIVS
jgi:plastocyanin